MKKRILIVDDSPVNRRILEKILSEDYSVLEAENGQEALALLEQQEQWDQPVAAVLLDLVMPVMDGFEFLKQYKTKQHYVAPVIVVTAREAGAAELEALELGAVDYLAKPYNPELIKRRLRNLIELQESALLMHVIERDELTGAYSKEVFYHRADDRLKAEPERNYWVVCTDIEHFKVVNDLFGFETGNQVLAGLASALQQSVGPEGLVGRLSSDVFGVLLPAPRDPDAWFRALSEQMNRIHPGVNLSLRSGVCRVEERHVPVHTLCDRAVLALENIKGAYQRDYAYYDGTLRERMLWEQKIADSMKDALKCNQFEVYYQPKYDLLSDRIAGAEALTRWNHPELGFISPGDFIPLFEKNGFIVELDRYVWRRVCADLRDWLDRGLPVVPVSVNMSRTDIYDPQLTGFIQGLLQEYGLTPKHLHLEITESAYTENSQQLIEAVSGLKQIGFPIEMDDFGKGYSSLNMLSALPIDVLKLDMQFLQNGNKRKTKSILGFTVGYAKWIGLSVVAEGVETLGQVNMLRNMECDYVQGYYFYRPMPHDVFEEHLKAIGTVKKPLNNGLPPMPPTPEIRLLPAPPKKMLVVDDSELNRAMLREEFKDLFEIDEVENGLQAMKWLQQHSAETDIVMLDLIMPEMDGLQVLEKMAQDPALAQIPVVVTSVADEDSEERAMLLGACDFISKPYRSYIIRRRVANIVNMDRALRALAQK